MTSPFFQNQTYVPEQQLHEDLIIECIATHGIDAMWLPRKQYSLDGVLSEDQQMYFDEAVPCDVYLESADSFQGQGAFLSQYGIELRDQITITVARRAWNECVGRDRGLERPREGDLVWFAVNGRLFEVREVRRYSMLYPFGALPTWKITCELIEASSQRIQTGIAAIDTVEAQVSEDLFRFTVRTTDGSPARVANGDLWVIDSRDEAAVDPLDEARAVQTESDAILDFNEIDPFADDTY